MRYGENLQALHAEFQDLVSLIARVRAEAAGDPNPACRRICLLIDAAIATGPIKPAPPQSSEPE